MISLLNGAAVLATWGRVALPIAIARLPVAGVAAPTAQYRYGTSRHVRRQ